MIDDVKELLSWGTSIREAIVGADAVKTKIRIRLRDYDGVLQVLLQSDFADVENELLKLRDIYEEIEALHVKHTAGRADPRWVKFAKKVNRGTQHKSIEEDLDAIDAEARQLFSIIAAKSSIDIRKTIIQLLRHLELKGGRKTAGNQLAIAGGVCGALLVASAAVMVSSRNEEPPIDVGQVVGLVLHDLQLEGVRVNFATQVAIVAAFGVVLVIFSAVMLAQKKALSTMARVARPPTLPERAAVPVGALALPRSYVERAVVREVADGLTNTDEPRAPYTVVGMGGGGKTILASAVVREPSVREHFRGGIFWVRVGRGAKNSLLPLLQGLAREMGAAPTDSPHGVPHVLESLEQVKQHLVTVASTGTSPRLVVLDDVWEREVVDAFLPLGLKVMVTTRDESVVGVPTGCLKLGDMTEEEALELLLKTSRTVGRPGEDVRKQMNKVL